MRFLIEPHFTATIVLFCFRETGSPHGTSAFTVGMKHLMHRNKEDASFSNRLNLRIVHAFVDWLSYLPLSLDFSEDVVHMNCGSCEWVCFPI